MNCFKNCASVWERFKPRCCYLFYKESRFFSATIYIKTTIFEMPSYTFSNTEVSLFSPSDPQSNNEVACTVKITIQTNAIHGLLCNACMSIQTAFTISQVKVILGQFIWRNRSLKVVFSKHNSINTLQCFGPDQEQARVPEIGFKENTFYRWKNCLYYFSSKRYCTIETANQ